VRVHDLRLTPIADRCELSARVAMRRLDTEGLRITYRFPAELASTRLDASPYVAGLLATAMWWGEPLEIDGPVSPRLLASSPAITAVYRSMFPTLHEVEVRAEAGDVGAVDDDRGRASMFSGGVDSWYSVLKARARGAAVSHLVYSPSIDFMYTDATRASAVAAFRRAAGDVGCTPVVVETDLRRFTERFQHWGITHGGGLASIALTMGDHFAQVLVPSSFHLGAPRPWGSHPLLDPLWSTERMTFVHDGVTASRTDKLRYLAGHPVAVANLKVCHEADTTANCGRCSKCVRTMIGLRAAGVGADRAPFAEPLRFRNIRRLRRSTDPADRQFLVELVDELDNRPDQRPLRRALRRVQLDYELQDVAATVFAVLLDSRLGSAWRRVSAHRRRTGSTR
jgi:hypothetical protein